VEQQIAYCYLCGCGTIQGATAKVTIFPINCCCGTKQGATAKCYHDSFSTNRVVKATNVLCFVYSVYFSLLVVGIKKSCDKVIPFVI
jgi:hypothetical protein